MLAPTPLLVAVFMLCEDARGGAGAASTGWGGIYVVSEYVRGEGVGGTCCAPEMYEFLETACAINVLLESAVDVLEEYASESGGLSMAIPKGSLGLGIFVGTGSL